VALALLGLASCNYTFQGGGGFPSEIRTVYIRPFDNTTPYVDLDQMLFSKLNERLPRALGVRPAGEEVADAWVRGKITRYEDAAQNYRPGDSRGNVQVLQHQVQITIEIQLINRRNNTILWESQTLTGRGEYQPASQTDQIGREQALNNLLQQIIDGAQSQW
jgi:hypothetical protein